MKITQCERTDFIVGSNADRLQPFSSRAVKPLTLAVFAALTLPAASVQALELTDFTDPNTEYDEAYVNFNASANDGNQDQASYNALLSAFYNRQQSTDQRVFNFNTNGAYTANRGQNEGDKTVDDLRFALGASADTYLGDANDEMFWFGSGDYAYQESAEDDRVGFTVGVGYGRVWNATPLAKALRVQAALQKNQVVPADISDEALLALSDIIAKEDEYRSREGADTYRGSWYSDMEAVLNDAGALPQGELGALGTVRLDEVMFDEPISPRRHGWLVRAGAGLQISDFSGTVDSDPKLKFQFEYAKPYGLTGQLLETATYEPVFGDDTVHQFRNRLSYTYELSDTIDWLNAWDLTYQAVDDEQDTEFTTNTLTSSFLYELTNQLDLNLTVALTDTDDSPNLNTDNDDLASSMNMGLRYRVR